VFSLSQDALLCEWSLHGAMWYTEDASQGRTALQKVEMLQEILVVPTLFVTRIVVPIAVTLFSGYRLERTLDQNAPSV